MMQRAWCLPDKYPETGKVQFNSDWGAWLIILWCNDGVIWWDDDMTNWSRWSLSYFGIRRNIMSVLLWYKMQRHVSLVIQSLPLTTTQQPHNNCSYIPFSHADAQQLNVSVCQWCQHHYKADSKKIWRGLPVWTTGSHNKSVLSWLKTNLWRF